MDLKRCYLPRASFSAPIDLYITWSVEIDEPVVASDKTNVFCHLQNPVYPASILHSRLESWTANLVPPGIVRRGAMGME
ncbi:hypothetical protein M404DRAFT_804010 [Pisolithus tinctorius Marx 270]|uniref:Uncharacterized protein n=1 Tax=Pisolithus tinctorius Marx 270 TaxID=870435 RepID=A0A0C3KQV7_PISTI|nr:hypothetical protein M404DRAFT_804010 [Pisolithus tinctorius Marx 270]